MLEYAEAMRRALRGEIEGVCSSSGKLRYVRELTDAAKEEVIQNGDLLERGKPQPMNAITNLGAYRQHLQYGAVWALCLCRGRA